MFNTEKVMCDDDVDEDDDADGTERDDDVRPFFVDFLVGDLIRRYCIITFDE